MHPKPFTLASFCLLVVPFALTAWLTASLRDSEVRLKNTAVLLARTEARLEKSRTEVRDLKKSVDEVKKMVGTLVEDSDEGADEEYADEESVNDGPYLANRRERGHERHSRPDPSSTGRI